MSYGLPGMSVKKIKRIMMKNAPIENPWFIRVASVPLTLKMGRLDMLAGSCGAQLHSGAGKAPMRKRITKNVTGTVMSTREDQRLIAAAPLAFFLRKKKTS